MDNYLESDLRAWLKTASLRDLQLVIRGVAEECCNRSIGGSFDLYEVARRIEIYRVGIRSADCRTPV